MLFPFPFSLDLDSSENLVPYKVILIEGVYSLASRSLPHPLFPSLYITFLPYCTKNMSQVVNSGVNLAAPECPS